MSDVLGEGIFICTVQITRDIFLSYFKNKIFKFFFSLHTISPLFLPTSSFWHHPLLYISRPSVSSPVPLSSLWHHPLPSTLCLLSFSLLISSPSSAPPSRSSFLSVSFSFPSALPLTPWHRPFFSTPIGPRLFSTPRHRPSLVLGTPWHRSALFWPNRGPPFDQTGHVRFCLARPNEGPPFRPIMPNIMDIRSVRLIRPNRMTFVWPNRTEQRPSIQSCLIEWCRKGRQCQRRELREGNAEGGSAELMPRNREEIGPRGKGGAEERRWGGTGERLGRGGDGSEGCKEKRRDSSLKFFLYKK